MFKTYLRNRKIKRLQTQQSELLACINYQYERQESAKAAAKLYGKELDHVTNELDSLTKRPPTIQDNPMNTNRRKP